MKISSVELFHVEIPLPKPFYPTWIPGYPQTHNSFTLIRLTTKCGIEGWSAGAAMGHERQGLGELIGGYLIGLDPEDIETANQRLKEASYLGWRNYWIEPAFWDILGKSKGKPVYELMGGTARPVEFYCSTGEMHEPEKRAEELLAIREKGFKTAKMRLKNIKAEDDIRHVNEVMKRVGDKIRVSIDVNQGWLVTMLADIPAWTLDRATEFVKVCEDNGIAWLEEPLDSRDYDGLAELRKRSGVTIAGAELNYGWNEVKVMIEKGSFDVYQPDSTFCGMADAKMIMDTCKKQGLGFSPHTWTNGIGLMINMNMWLADKDNNIPLEYPMETPSWVPEARDGILEQPVIPDREAMYQPPCEPGLGIKISPKKLKKYGERFFKLTEFGLKVKIVKEKGLKQAIQMSKQQKQRQKNKA
ncbi:MAG TPA: mandelate racemase/muconate lactonizing enzyme family protein [bacterium]|nr:mandelate racemase/muconate lactonizing enzyme family protein [bacterium]